MKIYDDLYVGMKPDSDGYFLGYMTWVDNTKAFEQRKNNIKQWLRGDTSIEAKTFKNEPTSGFRIVGYDSRYSTSNKVAEILDPRGFKLQMYMEEFIDLILSSTIVNGNISGEFLWGRNNKGQHCLINVESDLYKNYLVASKTVIKTTTVYPVGAVFRTDDIDVVYKYYGAKYLVYINCPPSNELEYYGHYKHHRNYQIRIKLVDVKPIHIYGEGFASGSIGYRFRKTKMSAHEILANNGQNFEPDFSIGAMKSHIVVINNKNYYTKRANYYDSKYYTDHQTLLCYDTLDEAKAAVFAIRNDITSNPLKYVTKKYLDIAGLQFG